MDRMKTLRPFIEYCLHDEEFLAGGIPTKEEFYKKKLNMTEEQLSKFYDGMYILYHLSKELKK